VLWLGMAEGAEALVRLATALENALKKRGFPPENRKFSAHLTLGRVRDPHADWTERLAAAPAVEPSAGRFRVERLALVHSQLSPKGSIYRVHTEGRLVG
jgi:2'-5' RNA ligase